MPVYDRLPGVPVTVYDVIGLPPVEALFHATVMFALPIVPVKVGAVGVVIGVTTLDGSDGIESPASFDATTEN